MMNNSKNAFEVPLKFHEIVGHILFKYLSAYFHLIIKIKQIKKNQTNNYFNKIPS